MSCVLKNKIALATGAGQGIGAGIAALFAAEGAKVAVADINQTSADRTVADIKAKGGTAVFIRLDVTDEASWKNAFATVSDTFGPIDILVNNAGINFRHPLEEFPVDEWDKIMAVNVRGVFLGTKHAIPIMREHSGGSIINMSSICGLIGHKYSPIGYITSKGAVTLFTKAMATQYAQYNIRTNSIHPSTSDTPLVQELLNDPVRRKQRLDEVPLGRLAAIEDIAQAALFLASDAATFINGVAFPVDGGLTAG